MSALFDHIRNNNAIGVIRSLYRKDSLSISLALLATATLEKEKAAVSIVKHFADKLDVKVARDTLRIAASNDEARLIDRLLRHCADKLSNESIIDALRMAIVKQHHATVKIFTSYDPIADFINDHADDNQHPVPLAIDSGDAAFLDLVLSLPGIEVTKQHVTIAQLQDEQSLAEKLETFLASSYHHHLYEVESFSYELEQRDERTNSRHQKEKKKRAKLLSFLKRKKNNKNPSRTR